MSIFAKNHIRDTTQALGIICLSTASFFGCDRKESHEAQKQSMPQPQGGGEIAKLPKVSERKTISYDLPLICPPGQEFIKEDSPARLSQEQRTIINSAYYLWRIAVAAESDERANIAKQIEVLPSVDKMPADSPFLGPVKAALAPLELKAALVTGTVETINTQTQERQQIPFRFFTFNGIGPDTSYFAVVGSLGHEAQHGVQSQSDRRGFMQHPPQVQFARELDAYAREAQDLILVAKYLKNGGLIDPTLRANNLDSWLTDLAGALHSAGYYSFRFKTQQLAAITSSSLEKIGAYLTKNGLSAEAERMSALRLRLSPLLEYRKDLSIDTEEMLLIVADVRTQIESSKSLNPDNDQKMADQTAKFLSLIATFKESVQQLREARDRLNAWKADPQPFRE